MPSRIFLFSLQQRGENAMRLYTYYYATVTFLFLFVSRNVNALQQYSFHRSTSTSGTAGTIGSYYSSAAGCSSLPWAVVSSTSPTEISIAAMSISLNSVKRMSTTRIRNNSLGSGASSTALYDSSSSHVSTTSTSARSSIDRKSETKDTQEQGQGQEQEQDGEPKMNHKRPNTIMKRRKKRASQMDTTTSNHHHPSSISSSSSTVNNSGFVSEEELAHHVSSMYIRGPGGIFNEISKKRERNRKVARKHHGTDSSSTTSTNHRNNVGANGLDGEYDEYLRKLDRHPALVLNADFQPLSVLPLSIWPWQETIKSLFSGKVTVVDVYPDLTIRAVNMNVPLPSVIALTEYVKQPNQVPAFTRRNVFLRDGYKCQYCARSFVTRDLSLDHVNPRCNGGRLEWTNTVTSCRKCNGKKGSTPPNELKYIGMKLVREPRIPSKWELAANAEKMVPKRVHPTWRPFLGMNMLPTAAAAGSKDGHHDHFMGDDMESFFEGDFEY